MAQPSVYFSAGRLTMLQRNVLDAAGMERLLSTASCRKRAKRSPNSAGRARTSPTPNSLPLTG